MDPKLETALRLCPNLPSLSSVAMRVVELGRDPEADIDTIAGVISQDPALATKMIRVANSAMYARRQKIASLRDALSFLGLNSAMAMALSFSLATTLDSGTALRPKDLSHFWRRSLLSALACRLLGEKIGEQALDNFFLAGLLQDLGMLALGSALPAYRDIVARSKDHLDLIARERVALGVDHSAAGAWLMQHWGMPKALSEATKASHDGTADGIQPRLKACVAVSGTIADIYLDTVSERAIARAVKAAKARLGISQEQVKALITRFAAIIPETESLFETALLPPMQVAALTEHARELLALHSAQLIQAANESRARTEELEEERLALQDAAERDPLTKLHNRRYLDRVLPETFSAAASGGPAFSLAIIDIDYFKRVNDSYGHDVGDVVLRRISKRIASATRSDDHLVRMGGEEFALLLLDADLPRALGALERIRRTIEATPVRLRGLDPLYITISAGLASYSNNFSSYEEMLKATDQALYVAKERGRNRVVPIGRRAKTEERVA